MVILIWVDDAYGLISWKMDLELGATWDTTFGNPDFVAYAENFGAVGYEIRSPDQLLPTLQTALATEDRLRHRLSDRLLGEPGADSFTRGAR